MENHSIFPNSSSQDKFPFLMLYIKLKTFAETCIKLKCEKFTYLLQRNIMIT